MTKPNYIDPIRPIGDVLDGYGQKLDGVRKKEWEREQVAAEKRIAASKLTVADKPVVGLGRYLGKLHFVGGRDAGRQGIDENSFEIWKTADKKRVLFYPVTRGKLEWVPVIATEDPAEPIATITAVFNRPMSLREARAAYRSRRKTGPSARRPRASDS